ncbi:HNH endonuclease family protein [Streptomonospora nanhaiensis]|uniref:GmrSD restriction endonucleases C-terminal domain-containing protein n=2 Tax=Streptomonospora nanhaiensis TaxID=1323731 RepID=A0A853BGN7_9ACTN|nr:HNH endonuclease family protein [Streptomonospora nanhaiensis]MBV2366128.1 HNH endonuclease family protein [Streptomonospora nanhaiensis]NYI93895.1 hypothetical protein [Streptomonospora nanhaiensis]
MSRKPRPPRSPRRPRPARRAGLVVAPAALLVLVVAAALLTGADPLAWLRAAVGAGPPPGAPDASGAPPAGDPVSPEEAAAARADLRGIETAPPASGDDYERDAFGSDWVDTDDNGCPTRHDILARDLEDTEVAPDCTVVSGVLEDPYTGERITFSAEDPMEVQIDHVVPLALAWRTGAQDWDRDRRVEFANDPDNLLASDGSANQAKGDSGPGEWRPYAGFRCAYAVAYVGVVDEYGLTLPPADRAALADMLDTC